MIFWRRSVEYAFMLQAYRKQARHTNVNRSKTFGYNRSSLVRAPLVVNCHLILHCRLLRSVLPRNDFSLHGVQVRQAPIETPSRQNAQFAPSHVEPTAVLGRVVDFQTRRHIVGFPRRECLIQGSHAVGVQIVHQTTHARLPGSASPASPVSNEPSPGACDAC